MRIASSLSGVENIYLSEVYLMAVQEIKQFKQQNGIDILKIICKTTKNFPEGNNYFYCDAK